MAVTTKRRWRVQGRELQRGSGFSLITRPAWGTRRVPSGTRPCCEPWGRRRVQAPHLGGGSQDSKLIRLCSGYCGDCSAQYMG